MMKKILSILIFIGTCTCAQAQKRLPADPYPKGTNNTIDMLRDASLMGHAIRANKVKSERTVNAVPSFTRENNEETTYIGYKNPKGTLFLGMDEAGDGFFFEHPGIIGGWSDSIECWVWPNQQTDYKSIRYLNPFSEEYSEYEESEYYWIDKEGNFCDAIVADGGYGRYKDLEGDYGAYWQVSTPLQIIKTSDGTEKKFVLLSSKSNPEVSDCNLASGGLPSSHTKDGLWPLTNAVSTTTEGQSIQLIAYKAEDGYTHYLYGSSKYTIDSGLVYNPETEQEEMEYTRVLPVQLTTTYDKPQTPLYIKNVTMAVSSETYSAFKPQELHFDTLFLTISTMDGKVLATTFATEANLSSIKNTDLKKGRLLTFPLLQDTTAFGEFLHEGLLVDKAFQISLTGFKETDKFAIYAAKCIIHPTHTQMLYEGGVTKKIAYEPYIMLNGIYPTMEDYYSINGAGIGQVGDTIPIKMIPIEKGKYVYKAAYAHWGSDNDEFAIRSSFTPYDSIARTWNMDVETPNYITLYADYERNINTKINPITIWEYYRMFLLKIYADSTPVIGDCIKIGKAGKYMIYRIDSIETVDDQLDTIESSSRSEAAPRTEKVLQDGNLFIRKDGKKYNVLGIQQ